MTTCRTIIADAMAELAVLPIGDEPTAHESSLGLRRLQSILDGLFGVGVGVALADYEVTSDSDLLADQRVLATLDSAVTLTMPIDPSNGARIALVDVGGTLAANPVTLDGNGRLIDGASTLAVTAGGTWLYVADAAEWQKVNALALDDSAPLGDDEFFTLELAKRLAPAFGAQLTTESQVALARATNRVKARFASHQVIPCDDAVRYLSRQSYGYWLTGR